MKSEKKKVAPNSLSPKKSFRFSVWQTKKRKGRRCGRNGWEKPKLFSQIEIGQTLFPNYTLRATVEASSLFLPRLSISFRNFCSPEMARIKGRRYIFGVILSIHVASKYLEIMSFLGVTRSFLSPAFYSALALYNFGVACSLHALLFTRSFCPFRL